MLYTLYTLFLQKSKLTEKKMFFSNCLKSPKEISNAFIEENPHISGPTQFKPRCSRVNCTLIQSFIIYSNLVNAG